MKVNVMQVGTIRTNCYILEDEGTKLAAIIDPGDNADRILAAVREEGVTVVVVSSELAELRSVCDRIAIVSEGRISRILSPGDSDAEFGLAMSGPGKGGEGRG